MSRSFQLVDDKLFEADFFLQKLEEAEFNLFEARCYLNAFVASTRTVTYALQAVMLEMDGFKEWYQIKQEQLKKDKLAKFFHKIRNESQHIGTSYINSGIGYNDAGTLKSKFYFQTNDSIDFNIQIGDIVSFLKQPDAAEEILSNDIVSHCKSYMKTLVQIIFDCYKQFGTVIDPEQYYTIENISALGMTIEDINEELGFPRDWFNVEGIDLGKQLELIKRNIPKTEIDQLFLRYLNKTRFSQTK